MITGRLHLICAPPNGSHRDRDRDGLDLHPQDKVDPFMQGLPAGNLRLPPDLTLACNGVPVGEKKIWKEKDFRRLASEPIS